MYKKVQLILIIMLITSFFFTSIYVIHPIETNSTLPFFTLVAKTNYGGTRPDYLNFLKQHVARIGINVNVIVQDWPTFVNELMVLRDFDICYIDLPGGGADPDFTGVYDENGSLNFFGYDESMDWNASLTLEGRTGWGINEWFMQKGLLIMPPNSEERIQHYWAWEQYLMDKILPCQPVFTPRTYMSLWDNLDGYNYADGIIQSWGKMDFDGTHIGQINTSEIVIADAAWGNLNPIHQDEYPSAFITSTIMDTLFYIDANMTLWPNLAKSYTFINDTYLRIICRDGVKWQNPGGYPDEYFDARDVYFTLYCGLHASSDLGLYYWIDDMMIINQNCIDIIIDGDPNTVENEPCTNSLNILAFNQFSILPEHYLNVTQLPDGITPDVSHENWDIFATHCFGTGLFEFGTFNGIETTLAIFNDCWKLNGSITADPNLNFIERFGNFNNNLRQLRIRIIPDIFTRLEEFELGKLDLTGITINEKNKYLVDPTKEIQSDFSYNFGFFGYNLRPERLIMGNNEPCPLDNSITKGLAVRKAISYAIDRVEMNNVVHQGEYKITDHPIHIKLGIWCNPNIIRYMYNLQLAKHYMNLAGYYLPITTIYTSPTISIGTLFLPLCVILFVILSFTKKIKQNFFS